MYALKGILLTSDFRILWVGPVDTRGQGDRFEVMMCSAILSCHLWRFLAVSSLD
jgi:hypothetical protein